MNYQAQCIVYQSKNAFLDSNTYDKCSKLFYNKVDKKSSMFWLKESIKNLIE